MKAKYTKWDEDGKRFYTVELPNGIKDNVSIAFGDFLHQKEQEIERLRSFHKGLSEGLAKVQRKLLDI